MSNTIKHNAIVFERPFTKYWSSKFAKNLSEEYKVYSISDFRRHSELDIMDEIYSLSDQDTYEIDSSYDLDEIIRRCRYLRNIDRNIAECLAKKAIITINSIFLRIKPKIFIGIPIDNYILHIINIYCDKNSVKALFPVGSFIPNYTRITKIGEWVKSRDISSEEINYIYHKITDKKFAPVTLKKHRGLLKLFGLFLRERLKWLIFQFLKFKNNDKYSFHYNTVYPSKGCISVSSISNIFSYKYFESVDATRKKLSEPGFKIYLPLQFSPETTIDYYIEDSRFGDYYKLIDEFVKGMNENDKLFIKEHPDLYGYRDISLYKLLKKYKNVTLCPVDMKTDELINQCDLIVVTGAGSTGAEAFAKGKNVMSLGGAFYKVSKLNEITKFSEVSDWRIKYIHYEISLEDRRGIIERILQNTVKGSCNFVRAKKIHEHEIDLNQRQIINYISL